MPISKTKMTNAAIAAKFAALPKIPKELLDQFVSGPMTGEAVNTASMAFKKALIERALGAELGHHLSYPNGAIKPEAVSNSQCDPASLNTHVHFHVCVVDGVFEALPEGVAFHAATGLDAAVIAQVQANVSKRILRAFVARGHIEACDAKDMAAYAHGGGFSVDAGVRIEAPDRAGLEQLLRYCARPPFAMERLKQRGADLATVTAVAVGGSGVVVQPEPQAKPKPRSPAHYLWAALIARIYEVFPLICPMCGGADVHHRFHHLQRRHRQDPGAHRGGQRCPAHHPGTRAAAVGRLWRAGAGGGR